MEWEQDREWKGGLTSLVHSASEDGENKQQHPSQHNEEEGIWKVHPEDSQVQYCTGIKNIKKYCLDSQATYKISRYWAWEWD